MFADRARLAGDEVRAQCGRGVGARGFVSGRPRVYYRVLRVVAYLDCRFALLCRLVELVVESGLRGEDAGQLSAVAFCLVQGAAYGSGIELAPGLGFYPFRLGQILLRRRERIGR